MLAFRVFAALFLLCAAPSLARAESTSTADFHSKVVALYSFEPHKLDQGEIQAKSTQLDQFWAMVKADPPSTLPLLRRELETPSNSAFFFFDGSKLLLALSKDRSDRALALRSIAKADLRGIQPTDYVRTIHWLAGEGFDTREAAFGILAFPDIKVFIPQHALTLGQDYALICMLFPMDETLFVPDLTARLADESNVQSQKSLLLALWYTVTPVGEAAIRSFADSQKHQPEATTYAKASLGRGSLNGSADQSLREQRRKVMHRPISDEALIEFDQLTSKLIAK